MLAEIVISAVLTFLLVILAGRRSLLAVIIFLILILPVIWFILSLLYYDDIPDLVERFAEGLPTLMYSEIGGALGAAFGGMVKKFLGQDED